MRTLFILLASETKADMAENKTIYRITFLSQDTIYEIYAGKVAESAMFGFIEIEDFIFGETSSVVLDPSEERIRAEFKGVKRTYIPMQEVYRIDEVEQRGKAKVTAVPEGTVKNNVSPFPSNFKLDPDLKG